ncbi:MAG: lipoate--protein ligase [Bacteroidales bacterium]|nr:lipoate--protein ligase [Bacteroidales bacterium]
MRYVINNCTDAHWNMAHDEFLLEGLRGEAVFCLWQNAPAVIIGLNQSAYAEVNLPYLEAHGIKLARRVTGGGAVYHDLGNLNYSIVGPAREVEKYYDLMADALRRLGLPAERTGRNDIMVDGLKCSGWAKRLSKDRMMIHGTLMWDVDLEALTEALAVPGSKLSAAGIASVRSRVCNLRSRLSQFKTIDEFKAALHGILADGDYEIHLTDTQKAQITEQVQKKFSTWDWVYGRSPKTEFKSTKKFPCGTVTAHYTLTHGVFSELEFTGDFIGNRPASELSAALIGKRLEDVLSQPVQDYFEGVTPQEFLSVFPQL